MELRRRKIPYVLMGGMSFYDHKEVRDILAYVKLLAHPSDEVSLLRIINLPARGISQTTVKRLMEEAIRCGRPLWEVLPQGGTLGLPAAAVEAIGRFRAMIERFQRDTKTQPLVEVIKTLIREIRYKDELTKLYPNAADQESRWASVEELVNAAAAYSQRESGSGDRPTAAGFLQEVALTGDEFGQDKETKLERDAVALMTLHAAKGLEFREVYMVGMEEGTLPHHRSIAEPGAAVDEERRLCYVGVTRAQRRLILTLALNRMKWGKSRPTIPSRFLYELTGRADNPNYQAAIQGQHKRPAKTPQRKK
jgi:DNA helicase-2/ATP-dependent DNA helicase PcrA